MPLYHLVPFHLYEKQENKIEIQNIGQIQNKTKNEDFKHKYVSKCVKYKLTKYHR